MPHHCDYCGDRIAEALPFECNECGEQLCSDHRLPEDHWCAELRRSENTWSTVPSDDSDSVDRTAPTPMDMSSIPGYSSGDDTETGDPSPDVKPDGSIAVDQSRTAVVEDQWWSFSLSWYRKQQLKRIGRRIVYMLVVVGILAAVGIAVTPLELTDVWQSPASEAIDTFLNRIGERLNQFVGSLFS